MEHRSKLAINPRFGMFKRTGGFYDAIHPRYTNHRQHRELLQRLLPAFPQARPIKDSADRQKSRRGRKNSAQAVD